MHAAKKIDTAQDIAIWKWAKSKYVAYTLSSDCTYAGICASPLCLARSAAFTIRSRLTTAHVCSHMHIASFMFMESANNGLRTQYNALMMGIIISPAH